MRKIRKSCEEAKAYRSIHGCPHYPRWIEPSANHQSTAIPTASFCKCWQHSLDFTAPSSVNLASVWRVHRGAVPKGSQWTPLASIVRGLGYGVEHPSMSWTHTIAIPSPNRSFFPSCSFSFSPSPSRPSFNYVHLCRIPVVYRGLTSTKMKRRKLQRVERLNNIYFHSRLFSFKVPT